jgi:galactokinase
VTGQQAAAAARGYRLRFGAEPEAVWAAPGRVNLIGEHTDYQMGLSLPIAIDRHVVAAAGRRPDRRLCAWSETMGGGAEADLDLLRPGPAGAWFNYVAGVAAALGLPGGVNLFFASDLPVGAGLSSSAALEVAAGSACNALFGLGRSGRDVALAGQHAEHAFAGVSTGLMDQLASALGQEGCALLLDHRSGALRTVPWEPERAGLVLGVVDSRAPHRVTGGGYQRRFEEARAAAVALGLPSLREASPEAAESLEDPVLRRRARHIVSENGRVDAVVAAAGVGDWAAVGRAFSASHRSLAEDYEVSHPVLDGIVAVAGATPGVLGARLTGAGFGGSAIVLMETGAEENFAEALRAAYGARGWEPFSYAAVRAAGGARALRGGGGA